MIADIEDVHSMDEREREDGRHRGCPEDETQRLRETQRMTDIEARG